MLLTTCTPQQYFVRLIGENAGDNRFWILTTTKICTMFVTVRKKQVMEVETSEYIYIKSSYICTAYMCACLM